MYIEKTLPLSEEGTKELLAELECPDKTPEVQEQKNRMSKLAEIMNAKRDKKNAAHQQGAECVTG